MLLAFLTECLDSVSTESLGVTAEGLIKSAREFVLSKDKSSEFKVQLSREAVLDVYLFFGEFKVQVEDSSVLKSIHEGLKSFLLGGSDER